jgi:curved DNA-binding protein CbpA
VKRLSERSFYEILEVRRSATTEEVQRAYERARALFGPGSLASYALLDPDEADVLHDRIEEARSVLLDPQARATYDDRLPAEGESKGRPAPGFQAAKLPVAPGAQFVGTSQAAVPEVDFHPPEGTPWTGDLIRQAREARGLSILQLSEKTKVQRSHLGNVESERFDQLPPAVYLRGIVLSIASALRLDGERVARSYMERAAGAGAPVKGR